VIDSEVQTFKHKKMDILKLPIKRTYENIELDPALAASIVPTEVRVYICAEFYRIWNHTTVFYVDCLRVLDDMYGTLKSWSA
jgi:hypothetical protein